MNAARYAPGGDIYQTLSNQYGRDGADRVYRAHQSGKSGAVAEALADLRLGPAYNDSTGSIFFEQITTDPFAAPLESANRGVGTAVTSAIKNLFKNPWVLLVVAVVVVVYFWPVFRPLVARRLK